MAKTILVTGGAKGIGGAICEEFAKAGYSVACNFKKSESEATLLCKRLAEEYGVNAIALQGDMSKIRDAERVFGIVLEKFKGIDVVVNNAGVAMQKLLIDCSEAEIEDNIANNLLSSIYCSREAVKKMLACGGGRIINISSIWGISGAACEAVYSAAKAGVIGLTKALAEEVGRSGILVNCIAPGVIETDMLATFTDKEKCDLAGQTSLGRLGRADEIASLALYLASDKANYITGQVITVAGGFK